MELTDTATPDNVVIDSLLNQLVELQAAPEPGTARPGAVVARSIEEDGLSMPLPMVVAGTTRSAGYTYVWDRSTGERSPVNNNMLRQALEKRHPDDPNGPPMFLFHPPKDANGQVITPHVGTHKCRLHPDDPERAEWDRMGLKVCRKGNLKTAYDVTAHMEHRHKLEWKTILLEQERREKEEEREYRRLLLRAETERLAATGVKVLAGKR